MRLIYLDEAGVSNKAQEPWLVVGGVIVDADRQLVALERKLTELRDVYIPEEKREGFIFHATELFNGGGRVFNRKLGQWPLEKRLEIAERIASLPRRLHLRLVYGFLNRHEFSAKFSKMNYGTTDETAAAHVTAFITCCMHVERYMRVKKSGEIAMLIVEDTQRAKKLITLAHEEYQDPRRRIGRSEEERKFFPYRRIKASPLFENKTQSLSLQLADFCAYVMKKKLMRDSRYDKYIEMMYSQIVFGL